MHRARIVYQDWIVRIGHDPDCPPDGYGTNEPAVPAADVENAVTSALASLDEDEREFIARFHFMGESYQEISEKSGRLLHKLEALHKRALKKLKRHLESFVARKYGLPEGSSLSGSANECCICTSSHRDEINQLINAKRESDTWRPILKRLRENYGIVIRSPQALIGHQKYHARSI